MAAGVPSAANRDHLAARKRKSAGQDRSLALEQVVVELLEGGLPCEAVQQVAGLERLGANRRPGFLTGRAHASTVCLDERLAIASAYASTVSWPHFVHVSSRSIVLLASAPRASSWAGFRSSDSIWRARAAGSRGGTRTIPPPEAAISSGPSSPRQPMAGTAPAIASI